MRSSVGYLSPFLLESSIPFTDPTTVLVTVTCFFILFIFGLVGFSYAAHLLGALVFIELVLLSWGTLFAVFAALHLSSSGIVSVVTLISLGAAEAAVALGFVIAMFLTHRTDHYGRLRFARAVEL